MGDANTTISVYSGRVSFYFQHTFFKPVISIVSKHKGPIWACLSKWHIGVLTFSALV